MKTRKVMTIEKAVEYSLNKKIVIHVPTQEMYNSLGNYVKKNSEKWLTKDYFPEYKSETCVNLGCGYATYSNLPWYESIGYEIIELIPDKSLTITIQSDGHKNVNASCNNFAVEVKNYAHDTLDFQKASHLVLNLLFDKMNQKESNSKFKHGDIVEVLNNTLKSSFGGLDESIGLQGVVMTTNEDEGIGVRVKFPILLDGFDEFEYDEYDLKLIRRP